MKIKILGYSFLSTAPCSTIEIATNVHVQKSSSPLVVEFSFNIDTKSLYDSWFGKGASEAPSHKENYECATKYAGALGYEVDIFLNKTIFLMDFSARSISGDKKGFTRPTQSRKPRTKRTYGPENKRVWKKREDCSFLLSKAVAHKRYR